MRRRNQRNSKKAPLNLLHPLVMDLYADNILDHYKHPHHHGELSDASIVHTENNPSCGDILTLHVKIDGERVTNSAWTGDGCAISQAGMSILSDELSGKTITELASLDAATIQTMLGIPVGTRRLKCALLCLHTLQNALHAYKQEPAQAWHETIGKI